MEELKECSVCKSMDITKRRRIEDTNYFYDVNCANCGNLRYAHTRKATLKEMFGSIK